MKGAGVSSCFARHRVPHARVENGKKKREVVLPLVSMAISCDAE